MFKPYILSHCILLKTYINPNKNVWTGCPFEGGLPESGSELRSAHSTRGMELVSPESFRLRDALSIIFFTSDMNIMVCTSFTSEYSGSQCM